MSLAQEPGRRGEREASLQRGAARLLSRRLLFAATSFLAALSAEVFLEAALQRRHWRLPGHAVGLVVTCAEFFGCCVLSVACGGSIWDEGPIDAHGATSWTQKLLEAASKPRQSARSLLTLWAPYIALAFLLFCGSGLANLAVVWVQFPVKVVIKSSKLVPAMLVSTFVGNSRSYEQSEYIAALVLCTGVAVFSISPGHVGVPSQLVALGVLMLLLAVMADVVALNTQQWLMQRRHVAPMSLMLRQNLTSFVCTFAVLLYTGHLQAALMEEPLVLCIAMGFGLLTSLAVWANTHLVHEAGSVTQVALSTGRKGLTVVLSYLLFPKPFMRSHGVAAFLLLAALCLQSRAERRRGRRRLRELKTSGVAPRSSRFLKLALAKVPSDTMSPLDITASSYAAPRGISGSSAKDTTATSDTTASSSTSESSELEGSPKDTSDFEGP